jgi:hypothetical protein
MLMIDVYAKTGTFADKHRLAADLARALMTIEQVPDIPLFRTNTAAFIHEIPDDALPNVDGNKSFEAVFSADVSDAEATLMATTQRPISELACGEATVDPAWKLKPRREVDDRADRRRARQPVTGPKEEAAR